MDILKKIHELEEENQLNTPKQRITEFNRVEEEFKSFYDWLMDDNREPANTKFTSGWKRNLAREIEYRIDVMRSKF